MYQIMWAIALDIVNKNERAAISCFFILRTSHEQHNLA